MFLPPHYIAHRLLTCECPAHHKHSKRTCYAVRAMVIGHVIWCVLLLVILGFILWDTREVFLP